MKFHPNLSGLKQVAESDGMTAALVEAGDAVADNVRAMNVEVGDLVDGVSFQIALPVDVGTDGSVAIVHPAGQAVQAKHGALTKGASQAGLKVGGPL